MIKIAKFVLKWTLRLFVLAVVLLIIFVLSLDSLARVLMEHNIRSQTGMDAEIGRVSIGLIEPRLEIHDLKLFNSKDYGGTPFLNIPEIHIEYDRFALAQYKIHLTLMRFNLGELDIVKNEAGQTNIFALGLSVPIPNAKPTGPVKMPDFQKQTGLKFESIDALNLSIGTLKYIDLKNQRNNRTQKIGIENFILHNVKAPTDLVAFSVLVALRSGDFFTSLMGQKDAGTGTGIMKLLY